MHKHAWIRLLKFHWPHLIALAFALALIFGKLQPVQGKLGHDYAYYFPHMLVGAAHFWNHALAVPHFVASLCTGIPFFADPQNMYYSLPQLLSFFLDPYYAALVTYLLSYLIGYFAVFFLLFRYFACSTAAAHLAALAFSLNGFAYAHFYVGHVTHYPFQILPVFLLGIFSAAGKVSSQWWGRVAFVSLGILYLFYSGSTHILMVGEAMGFVFLPLLMNHFRQHSTLRDLFKFLFFAHILAFVGALARLAVLVRYAEYFVGSGIDRSDLSLPALLTQYFFFFPSSAPQYIPFGRIRFGSWEFIGFVTKFALPFTLAAIIHFWGKASSESRKRLLWVIACCGFISLLAFGAPFNELLPILRKYHNPVKLLAALVLVWVVGLARGLDALDVWARRWDWWPARRRLIYGGIVVLLLAEFAVLSRFIQENPSALGYPYSPQVFSEFKRRGAAAPVKRIVAATMADEGALFLGTSSLYCYEPVFGYQFEALRSRVVEGLTDAITDGRFNLTHPGCFLYPGELSCRGWDKIPADQPVAFENFRSGRPVPEWVPAWHEWLLGFCLLWVAVLLVIAVRGMSGVLDAVRRNMIGP